MPHLSVSRLLLPGAVVLILNSAYLVAAPTASLWYYANVVAHPLLGSALALAVAPRVVRREWAVGPLAVAGAGVVGVGLLLGLVVLVRGATRQYEPILYAHIATSVAGAALLVVDTWRRATGAASRVWAVRGALVAIVAAGVAAPIVANPTRRQVAAGVSHREPDSDANQHGRGRRRTHEPVLSVVRRYEHRRSDPIRVLPDQRDLRQVSRGHLRSVELVGPPFLVIQQPVVPQVDRVHAGCRGHAAIKVVCRLS